MNTTRSTQRQQASAKAAHNLQSIILIVITYAGGAYNCPYPVIIIIIKQIKDVVRSENK